MMAAGSSTVPLSEQVLTRALMTVVELGRGSGLRGKLVNQQSLSSMDFAPLQCPTSPKQEPS